MKNTKIYLFAIVLLFFGSCEGEKESIPAYIHVKPFIMDTNNNQGTNASKFPDVWLSSREDGSFLGNYELPATIPLLETGNTELLLEAGIKENGIKNTPDIYGVLERFAIDVDLQPNEIDTIQPVVSYLPNVVFHYIEDFDNNNTLDVILDSNIMTTTSLVSDGAFDGKSVKFSVDEDNPIFEVATNEKMQLPVGVQKPIYLEMHYKNEGLLEVGLVGYESGKTTANVAYFIALNPQEEWNKIYIDLSAELSLASPFLVDFQIIFGTRLQEGATSADFYIDNIKVLHL